MKPQFVLNRKVLVFIQDVCKAAKQNYEQETAEKIVTEFLQDKEVMSKQSFDAFLSFFGDKIEIGFTRTNSFLGMSQFSTCNSPVRSAQEYGQQVE